MEQNNFGAADASSQSTTGNTGTSSTAGSMNDGQSGGGLKDRARDLAGNAQERLADVGSTVRDRAGNLKESLADALETGADKLRARTGTGDGLAGATGATGGMSGSMALENDGRAAQVTDRVATGMQASADWLRDADIDGLKSSIETQVKEHPGRTLLIAAGLGYLLGKALRK
jgi:ElaB/YqjD/DUF883 family membrane-anchored ribosome-binding protein